jgi:AcrR family transcriptional regulator
MPRHKIGQDPAQITRSSRTISQLKVAGYEIISEGGLTALTMSALSDRTGHSTAVVNYHFGSKENFIRSLLNDALDEAANIFQSSFADEQSLRGFSLVLARLAEMFRTKRSVVQTYLCLMCVSDSSYSTLARVVQAHNRTVTAIIAAIIEREQQKGMFRIEIDPRGAAVAMYATMRGMAMLAMADRKIDVNSAFGVVEQSLRSLLAAKSSDQVISPLASPSARATPSNPRKQPNTSLQR